MVRNTQEIGRIMPLRGWVNFNINPEIFTKETGLKIKQTVMVNIKEKMALNLKENGVTICRTERVKKLGLMVVLMKVSISKV